jgi:hypothetical protein
MKRIIILLGFSLFLCSTASAQGGGGESARKGSNGKAVTRKNSGTGNARAPNLTKDVKEQLAAQMVKSAYNPQWFKKCMDEAGGLDKIVDIEAISLSASDVQQYLLSGKVVESGESCAFGARTPMYWIYELRDGGVRLLADIGAADSVKVTSRRTNGYRDIQIGDVYNAGRSFSTTYMKYNGTTYK